VSGPAVGDRNHSQHPQTQHDGGRWPTAGRPRRATRPLTVGQAVVERLPVAISELFPHTSAVEGLLGMDFLGQFIVTLDRAAQQMWLASRQPGKLRGHLPPQGPWRRCHTSQRSCLSSPRLAEQRERGVHSSWSTPDKRRSECWASGCCKCNA
jgi:hypothetical protein